MPNTRTETDSLGLIEVPADALYGAQTSRAVGNFPISGLTASPFLIRALVMVKLAAAEANRELGLIFSDAACMTGVHTALTADFSKGTAF